MEYVCPMTCPKNMRNGPCGGTFNGQCEVIPEQACIWVEVYERAKSAHRVDESEDLHSAAQSRACKAPARTSIYFLNRDSRPDHPQPLITISNVKAASARASEETVLRK